MLNSSIGSNMPIYQLTKHLIFPDPVLAEESGILAVGGDLAPERLLLAYQNGIFPWYNQGEPIIWWSPDPRMVLYIDDLHVSRSMRRMLKKEVFQVTFDKNFKSVIAACKVQKRKGQKDTWITEEMLNAYLQLHELGYAHSVEVWMENQLVGGIYGVSLGRCFFGESMFSKVSNASKAGLITLANQLKTLEFSFIDCQVYTEHLASLGAREISRHRFLQALQKDLEATTLKGNWQNVVAKDSQQ